MIRRRGTALCGARIEPGTAGAVDFLRAQPTMVLHGNNRSRAFIISAAMG
jgi:hypothetical protein